MLLLKFNTVYKTYNRTQHILNLQYYLQELKNYHKVSTTVYPTYRDWWSLSKAGCWLEMNCLACPQVELTHRGHRNVSCAEDALPSSKCVFTISARL